MAWTSPPTPVVSCTDFSFATPGSIDFHEAAAAVARLGFTSIDVSVRWRFPMTPPTDVHRDPIGTARSRGHVLDSLGLRINDIFAIHDEPQGSRSRPPRSRGEFASIVQFASSLGATGITVLPDQSIAPGARRRERATDELRHRLDAAAAAGLELSFEPHQGSIADTPDAVLETLADVPGLRLTLDYSHFVAAGISPAAVHPLIGEARLIQVRQARVGSVQCPLADGTIDFAELVREATARAYRGAWTVEYVQHPARPADPIDAEVEAVQLRELLTRLFMQEGVVQ